MSDLTNLAAVQAVISSTMCDVKDIVKMSIDGYAQILSLIPEEDRKDVVLAVITANTADTASAERVLVKAIDATAVVVPAVITAQAAAAYSLEDHLAKERKVEHEERARREAQEVERLALDSLMRKPNGVAYAK